MSYSVILLNNISHLLFFSASGYSKLKSGKECKSGGTKLGTFSSVGQCADACRAKGSCTYFIYGTGSKSGSCWWEYTKTADCTEGWKQDGRTGYTFYEITGNICISKPFKLTTYIYIVYNNIINIINNSNIKIFIQK